MTCLRFASIRHNILIIQIKTYDKLYALASVQTKTYQMKNIHIMLAFLRQKKQQTMFVSCLATQLV